MQEDSRVVKGTCWLKNVSVQQGMERFSIECGKPLQFGLILLYDALWLVRKARATLNQSEVLKTKTNRDILARVFPRLTRVTCVCFEF